MIDLLKKNFAWRGSMHVPIANMEYISDWSSVPINRYEQAQKSENEYWSLQDHRVLTLHSQYYFYAGYYEWTKHRALINPFCVRPSRPQNFQIPGNAVKGKAILDIGCGPMSTTISLVHCAKVHVVDPLINFYKTIQPFGWEFFTSVSAVGAEQLFFDKHTFHFVHCWNVLDHTQDADKILREIGRVLVPRGQLLLGCDARGERGGGPAHPYKWSIETLEGRVFKYFEPVTTVTLLDHENMRPVSRPSGQGKLLRWVCRLEKKLEV